MKRQIALLLVTSLALSLAFAPLSYAGHSYRGGGHGYHHGGGHHGGYGYYAAGALVGGLLLGTVIGSAISQPQYVAPAPAYAYPAPAGTYAYPASRGYGDQEPPGEWVTVPGRWVNGKWVPSHRVWIPVEP